jgi:hypothetical protein
MTPILDRAISRRKMLTSSLMLGAGALALANTRCDPAITRRLHQTEARLNARHAVWVWQFSIDGTVDAVAETLASHGLAAIMKTHDGIEWMATYDDVPGAIDGPGAVETIAATFERYGVPFHAWSVVKGLDPVREAQMAADVLAAGARSLTLDLEHHEGFWVGSSYDAIRFGEELRARNQYARVDISIDPRPWNYHWIPLHEFVAFTDGIRPQLYWDTYNDADHVRAYEYMGLPPGANGITPEFLLEATQQLLAPLDRWILPVGQSEDATLDAWRRFTRRSWELGMPELSIWRYGVTDASLLDHLAATSAR